MSDLLACRNFSEGRVDHAGIDEHYSQALPERYYILKSLRDIFCKLPAYAEACDTAKALGDTRLAGETKKTPQP